MCMLRSQFDATTRNSSSERATFHLVLRRIGARADGISIDFTAATRPHMHEHELQACFRPRSNVASVLVLVPWRHRDCGRPFCISLCLRVDKLVASLPLRLGLLRSAINDEHEFVILSSWPLMRFVSSARLIEQPANNFINYYIIINTLFDMSVLAMRFASIPCFPPLISVNFVSNCLA